MQSKLYRWQEALADLITDPQELCTLLALDDDFLTAAQASAKLFPLKVPRRWIARMQKGNANDPLLRQVLPLQAELIETLGYSADPLQEKQANPIPGLLHKYPGRVLVTLTSACAVHCRYCFRREFPYAENNPGRVGWEKLFAYIANDESIHEVILSGGDPLTVSDQLLQQFSNGLQSIQHVKRLRIHTRLPIMLPERITPALIAWLTSLPFAVSMVVHANHPNEICAEVQAALQQLKLTHVTLLNQSVLLKGVNDDAAILCTLSEALFAAGALPYYLHVLDKVRGTAHFDVPRATAQVLHKKLCEALPGYLVPRLAYETPGALAKQWL